MMKIITSKIKASIKILFIGIVLAGGWWIWGSQVYSEIQKEVSITTDKTEYKQGETTKIVIINGLIDEIIIPYEGKELYGNFAELEKKKQSDEWMRIELPWISTKLMNKILKPGGKHIYFWKHQIAGDNYDIASPGAYRIKLGYCLKEAWRNGVIVYSNEFKIKKKQNKVTITVNKIEYKQGETIKITIRNDLDVPLRNCDMATKDVSFHNQFVGWGFIERLENGNWVKIEPLWRCGDTCFAKCKLSGNFFVLGVKGATKFPEDFRRFEWNQTRLICDLKRGRTVDSKSVGPGRYRISSTFWGERKSKGEKDKRAFYSDEFIIK